MMIGPPMLSNSYVQRYSLIIQYTCSSYVQRYLSIYSLDRELRYSRWKEAVERCKHWHKAEENETTPMKYIGK